MTDRERAMLEKLKAKEQAEKKEQAKLQRQFKDMCKKQFGHTPSEIADILQAKNGSGTGDKNMQNFVGRITTFYGLHSEDDIQKWLEVMLNKNSKQFWESRSGTPTETRETP